MNELVCAYCSQPIADENKAIYKYFAEEGVHKKVHFYHLQVKKGENGKEEYNQETGNATMEN